MPKDCKVYFNDILESVSKIEEYTKGMDYSAFSSKSLVYDGVVRNLEIIGEAVKNIPADVKKKYPEIEWKKIAGLRDILIHEYSGVDLRIIWDVVVTKLPPLKESVKRIMKELD